MKTRHLLWAIAALTTMLLTACSNNDDNVSQSATNLTPLRISASYDTGLASKTSYAESGATISATWDAGDQLYVVYNGKVNTLSLTDGAGTATATFEGSIIGTPTNNSVLICYVKDANNPSAVTVSNTGEYTYQSGTFLSQDGTLEGAAKCNLYYGTTTYGTGEDISCTFSTNTSMMKFTVYAPDDVNAGDEATLTYKSGDTEISKATFTVNDTKKDIIHLTIPAGTYTGAQTLTYKSGENESTETLSATKATFKAGETYSKTINYGSSVVFEVNSSNWSSAIAAFNAEGTPNPKLLFTSDINWSLDYIQQKAITRASGIVDFGGHTVTHMFLQNNEVGKNLTLMNGTVTGDATWHIGLDTKTEWADFYKGTVTLENMNVTGNIFLDGHLYIILSGNYHTIYNATTDGCPGKLIIYGGTFASKINENISGGYNGTYELYGGKYAIRPEDSWCANGYSVKANTDADASTYPYIVSAD